MKMFKDAYNKHKYSAGPRGIEFLLTFEEWLQIWTDSGHIHERGTRKNQYQMARFGDRGPYAVGNVRIITSSENHTEYNLLRGESPMRGRKMGPFSEEHKKKLSESATGKIRPPQSVEHIRKRVESYLRAVAARKVRSANSIMA